MKYKLLVFDMGGTLSDEKCLAPGDAMEKSYSLSFPGLEIPREIINKDMGMAKREHIKKTLDYPDMKELFKNTVGRFPSEKDVDKVYNNWAVALREVLPSRTSPFEGVKDLFEYVTEDYGAKIAITTGYPDEFREMCEKGLGRIMEYVDISSSPRHGKGRPFPYMIFNAMEATNTINVNQVLKIGDTVGDILAGQNAGVDTIAVYNSGTHNLNDFFNLPLPPKYVICRVKDLKEKVLNR